MRPCALPTVSVHTRSGGGDHAPEGGIVAEGERDVGLERRLVVLDREEVGAATVADDAADLLRVKMASPVTTPPDSGSALSNSSAAVISLLSGANCNWPITPPRASLKAARRCTPGAVAVALPRKRLPSMAMCPGAPPPRTQAPSAASRLATSKPWNNSHQTDGAGTRPRVRPRLAKAETLNPRPQRTMPS